MAPRTLALTRNKRAAGAPSRLSSLRTALSILAVVPSVALLALWTVSTVQLGVSWQEQNTQNTVANRAARPASVASAHLQEERRLSAAALVDPEAHRSDLEAQRTRTDRAVEAFEALSDIEASAGYPHMQRALERVRADLRQVGDVREAMDDGELTQQQTYERFTELIATDLRFLEALGQVEHIDVTLIGKPLHSMGWAKEMLSRQDALLARIRDDGHVDASVHDQLHELIGMQRHLFDDQVEPYLSGEEAEYYRKMTAGDAWRGVSGAQDALLRSSHHPDELVDAATRWQRVSEDAHAQLDQLIGMRVEHISAAGDASVRALLTRLVTTSVLGLGAVVVVVLLSVWLTRLLRRRILSLREEALTLERELPGVVERLRRGEDIDVDAEVSRVGHGDDELGRLGQALNTARRSAIETAVRETEQHRGFQRLLQRIARRTQLLIGLQMKKLDEMERRHEDPEVLEGLFDLDHLTARLRRYEENLVVLGGGQPQRRWRKPVKVLNVLRAALGEVQDYRRIRIDVEGQPWLSERAVGPVVHILAELMENAAAFSRPPTPVEVRAGMAGRGLVVEVEDRGLGMEPEEYERINRLLADPPRTDMMSRADDVRLGLYVVARMADGLGVDVELRPSVFGGTRAIVLIPAELVADGPGAPELAERPRRAERQVRTGHAERERVPAARTSADLPVRPRGRSMRAVAPTPADTGAPGEGTRPEAGPEPSGDVVKPLPRRVRQANLADALRKPPTRPGSAGGAPEPHPEPTRSGAAIGAFQRQSRAKRERTAHEHPPTGSSTPDRNPTTTEDPE